LAGLDSEVDVRYAILAHVGCVEIFLAHTVFISLSVSDITVLQPTIFAFQMKWLLVKAEDLVACTVFILPFRRGRKIAKSDY
jgi:hypothetical protein